MATENTENKENVTESEDTPRSNFFDTKKNEEIVKGKVESFSIKELLSKGYLTQKVNLTEDQTVTFMTIEHGVEFIIDRIVESYIDEGANRSRISLTAYVAAHIQDISGQPLIMPPLEYNGDNNEEFQAYLEAKIRKLMTYNSHFIKLITTHYFWFQERVHEFFKNEFMDNLENF